MHKIDIGINTEDKEIQLDYISVKKKLKDAIDGKITQTRLSEITGISQGRISTCLNEKNSDFFTFEQVYKICYTLGLSIDELVGLNSINNKKNILTPRKLCKDIAEAYINGEYGLIFNEEEVFDSYIPFNHKTGTYEENEKYYESDSIPRYIIEFKEGTHHGSKYDCFREIDGVGTITTQNMTAYAINNFLHRFLEICNIKTQQIIDDNLFSYLLEKLLEDIPDK